MKGASFGRGLCFALVAGLGALAWLLVLAPVFGYERSLSFYLLGLAVVAVAALAPSLRHGVGAGLLAALLCAALALTDPGLGTSVLGVLVVLGISRSALWFPRPFARALWFELALALGACALFASLYDGGLIGAALATWGFWLVQSAFALLPATSTKPLATPLQDPFDAARSAAEQLLERS